MTSKSFVDSNVWIYAFAETDDTRGKIARDFISDASRDSELIISYQVVNETTRILKKNGFSEPELRQVIDGMFMICHVCGFSFSSAELASELRETMSLSYWDSHIAANAVLAECDTLVSEDFQDDAIIRGVRVKNVFDGGEG